MRISIFTFGLILLPLLDSQAETQPNIIVVPVDDMATPIQEPMAERSGPRTLTGLPEAACASPRPTIQLAAAHPGHPC